MDRIIENISSSTEGYTTVEDCITRAVATATGAFCCGFSAGVAGQVHFAKYLSRPLKALLVIPTAEPYSDIRAVSCWKMGSFMVMSWLVTGSMAAVGVYRHGMKHCELAYMTQPAPVVHTISLHPAIQGTDVKIEEV